MKDLESQSSETQRQKEEIERQYLFESDHEEAYPTLEKRHGDPLEQVPKRILAVTTTQGQDPQILYLLSFKQNYQGIFYLPSYSSSIMLEALGLDDLMFDFFRAELQVSYFGTEIKRLDTDIAGIRGDLEHLRKEHEELQGPKNLY